MSMKVTKYKEVDEDEAFAEITITKWFGFKTVVEKYHCLGLDDFYTCWQNVDTLEILHCYDPKFKLLTDACAQTFINNLEKETKQFEREWKRLEKEYC